MIRRYRGYLCNGNREQIIAGVTVLVNQLEVRRQVPRVCTERGVGFGHNQFYLFVAYESDDDGVAEPEVEQLLRLVAEVMPCHGGGIGDFGRDELAGFVGQDVRVEEFARRLRYRPIVVADAGDPLADDGDDENGPLDQLIETDRLGRLLLWMSAHGEGSYASLDSARRVLGISMETRRVLRVLRLLGHCETSRDGRRWSIAPTVLAEAEAGRYVLCGARDEALLAALRERFPGGCQDVVQHGGSGPGAFLIDIDLPEPPDLGDLDVQVVQHADRALAEALPHLGEWAETLEAVSFDPQGWALERMRGDSFQTLGRFEDEEGFYRAAGKGPEARPFHLYYAPTLGWRRGEWTALRFLAGLREASSGKAICYFDSAAHELHVPLDWRWPEIYERTLVLSSGLLPRRDDNNSRLVYGSVEPELLETLCRKLPLEVDDL